MILQRIPSLLRRSLCFAAMLVLLVSCETISYYGQAAKGQVSLLWARESIESLLNDDNLSSDKRSKLELVLEVRQFAQQHLFLDAGNSYLSYVELNRPFVLWNVFAAPEFSTQASNWCYPIAGCVSYRGYFAQASATQFAAQLSAQSYDVYLGGVDAYSTLGWFNDPLNSAILRRSEQRLIALVFHELAHQKLYIPGDTSFNESFATFVEQEGLRRWYSAHAQTGFDEDLIQEARIEEAFVALVLKYRRELAKLYEQDIAQEQMRDAKAGIQELLREEYAQFRQDWDYTGYDRWFDGPLNNAQLSTVASYNELVPVFAQILAQEQGDLTRFYEAVQVLANLPHEARSALLSELTL
ncbi:MAG: aminopeptidase [Gammaproteobacteria bacterium]